MPQSSAVVSGCGLRLVQPAAHRLLLPTMGCDSPLGSLTVCRLATFLQGDVFHPERGEPGAHNLHVFRRRRRSRGHGGSDPAAGFDADRRRRRSCRAAASAALPSATGGTACCSRSPAAKTAHGQVGSALYVIVHTHGSGPNFLCGSYAWSFRSVYAEMIYILQKVSFCER